MGSVTGDARYDKLAASRARYGGVKPGFLESGATNPKRAKANRSLIKRFKFDSMG